MCTQSLLENEKIYEADFDIKDIYVVRQNIIKDHLIHDITGDMDLNDNCEAKENWNRLNDATSVEFEMFYYNELLPLGLATPDENQFTRENIQREYPVIDQYFFKLNDKNEGVYLLNPDIYYEPKGITEETRHWLSFMTGNGPLEELETNNN